MELLTAQILSLANIIGVDTNALISAIGTLSDLQTTNKTSVVAAINEVNTKASTPQESTGAQINDMAVEGALTEVWSADKVIKVLALLETNLATAIKDELIGGAGAAFDTFKELADAINSDPTFATTIATALNKRVRFDAAQTLTQAEKLQACTNIGIGDPTTDFVAAYNAAKAQ